MLSDGDKLVLAAEKRTQTVPPKQGDGLGQRLLGGDYDVKCEKVARERDADVRTEWR